MVDLSAPRATATRERLRARFGTDVEAWWAELPSVLRGLAHDWELELGEPVGSGNTSLVVRCRRAGRAHEPAILKLTPDPAIASAEATALRVWAPTGRVPAVYAAGTGALLLEAITPETPLAEQAESAPLTEVAALIQALHAPGFADEAAAGGIGSAAARTDELFALWTRRAAGDTQLAAALARGRALAAELAGDPPRLVLAHGDLHPGNVLTPGRAPEHPQRRLVAIDPRPSLADPASDAIDWVVLGVPARWRAAAEELAASLDVDPDRLWAWCRAFAARLAATEAATERRQAFRDMAV